MKSNSKNDLVKKLSICGQVAEHKSEKMRENGVDEEAVFASLSPDEKSELDRILTKLSDEWIKDHREHHKKNTAG